VNRAICDYTENYDERDELVEDLNERLEEDEDLGLDRPIGAVVAGICRAMRLPFDLALWEDEPWALLESEEKPKGSPYVRWRRSVNDHGGDDEDTSYAARSRHGVGPP
jgi:predicted nucleotidyltransferase